MSLYRLLLLAYPRAFRRLYAEEMEHAFAALLARARRRGRRAALRLWMRTVADVLRTGVGERLSRRGYRVGRSRLRVPRRALLSWISDFVLDLRHAVRTLARTPGYAVAVLGTLALGIGANTALFSVAYGTLLRPLPFGQGERLIGLVQSQPLAGDAADLPRRAGFSVADLASWSERVPALEEMAEYHAMAFTLIDAGGPHRVSAGVVSANYFDFLELGALHGRVLDPSEDHLGADPVIVLSYAYWRDRFGGDPAVVGQRVRMNDRTHEIVGVLPPGPQFPEAVDLYLPVSACPTRSAAAFMSDRGARMMHAYGRVSPGVGLAEVQRQIDAGLAELAAEHPRHYPTDAGFAVGVHHLRDEMVGAVRPVVVSLLVVAGMVLVIAWANAAGLALARATRRTRELQVRGVLGAGRGRLVRTLLAESLLLALGGGALGLLVAFGGHDLLVAFAARFTTRAQEIRLDRTVLAFALGTSVLTGLAFGAAPGWFAGRRVRVSALEGWGGTPGARSRTAHRWLVAAQVAVAFAVLTSAGLALRTAWILNHTELGFETRTLAAFRIHLPFERYQAGGDAGGRRFVRALLDSLAADPAVRAAARTMTVPLDPDHAHRDAYFLEAGDGRTASGAGPWRVADRELFALLGMERLEGRLFEPGDTLGAPPVAVVNRTFRARFMADLPLGTRLVRCHWPDDCEPAVRVVGVVDDVRYGGPDAEIEPEVYTSADQVGYGGGALVVRVAGDPDAALAGIRGIVGSLDPDVAVSDWATLERLRAERLEPRHFLAALLGMLALVAGGLALAGVGGVTSLAASARVRELGIRKALGARAGSLEALVLAEGALVVLPGLIAGAGLAAVLGTLLRRFLWGVAPRDPVTLIAVALAFVLVAGIASWLPARRAARVDVVEVLNAP